MCDMRRTGLILAGLLLVAASASAQTKPNFTGDWKLNTAKSNFGPMPAPSSLTQKITHADPELKVVSAQSGDMGDFNTDFTFTTDGKESQNQMGNDFHMTTVATWEGDVLVMNSTLDFQGNAMTGSDKWTLSPDGKTLTVQRHFGGPMGEGDATIVMDKQ
jgi:hypothetical protein